MQSSASTPAISEAPGITLISTRGADEDEDSLVLPRPTALPEIRIATPTNIPLSPSYNPPVSRPGPYYQTTTSNTFSTQYHVIPVTSPQGSLIQVNYGTTNPVLSSNTTSSIVPPPPAPVMIDKEMNTSSECIVVRIPKGSVVVCDAGRMNGVGVAGKNLAESEFRLLSQAGASVMGPKGRIVNNQHHGSKERNSSLRNKEDSDFDQTPCLDSMDPEAGSDEGDSDAKIIAISTNKRHTLALAKEMGVFPAYGVGFGEDEHNVDEGGRETWSQGLDFLIATIGFAVDLATVWRFPHLCYKNGGGAFLIPYFVFLFLGGLPLFYMEVILGQFHRSGPVAIWKIVPGLKGIGLCVCAIAYLVSFYYNVILGWSVYYLWSSLSLKLPWVDCSNEWNTDRCFSLLTGYGRNASVPMNYTVNNSSLAAYEFFELKALGMGKEYNFSNLGPIKFDLFISTFSIFGLLFLSLWKGVKSSGKVVWVTATAPYIILFILFLRGLMLPGSFEGIKWFANPDFSKLAEAEVWQSAAVQVFYSVGAGFGVHLAFSSYNKFDHNAYRDCVITIFVNCFTSVFSGLVVFTYLGYMATRLGIPIDDAAREGPGLVFIVYPEAIGTLPGSWIWAIIFFFMLLTLGVDSSMGGMESVLTGLKDELPIINKFRFGREFWTFGVIFSSFCFSMVNITRGGHYIFQVMDSYAAGKNLLWVCAWQSIGVAWFYGLDQFKRDVHFMLGFVPGIAWRLCWKFISPIFVLAIMAISAPPPLELVSEVFGLYEFPMSGYVLGNCFTYVPMMFVPGVAIYKFFTTPGTVYQKVGVMISPVWEHEAILNGGPVSRFKLKHWLAI